MVKQTIDVRIEFDVLKEGFLATPSRSLVLTELNVRLAYTSSVGEQKCSLLNLDLAVLKDVQFHLAF
jgi:hypothetical protein